MPSPHFLTRDREASEAPPQTDEACAERSSTSSGSDTMPETTEIVSSVPSLPDEDFIEALDAYLDGLVKGKDGGKVRLVLE